jgi:hypothetical protein
MNPANVFQISGWIMRTRYSHQSISSWRKSQMPRKVRLLQRCGNSWE